MRLALNRPDTSPPHAAFGTVVAVGSVAMADFSAAEAPVAGRTTVRDFLNAPFTGAKIVFSTYQSAQVVGAALKPGEMFDLAVFDKAHKTAGREGRNYACALEDSNLPIRKRMERTLQPVRLLMSAATICPGFMRGMKFPG